MQRDVFISYSRRNLDAVKAIKQQIDVATGTECWIDLEGIETGNPRFDKEIVEGINNCKVFLFMLSDESQQSEYALLELNYAKLNNKHVVIVNIDDCSMKGSFLFKYSLTDTIAWHNQPQREKLLRDLCRWLGVDTTQPAPVPLSSPVIDPLQELEERFSRLDKEIGDIVPFKGKNYKWGFKNRIGRAVIPCKWNAARKFCKGLAAVEDSDGKWGYIDKTGRVVIPCQWIAVRDFCRGLAVVRDSNGMFGYIDRTGCVIIPCQWIAAREFCEGLAAVKYTNLKWGFIDSTGSVVIPCQWDDVGLRFYKGLARVEDTRGKWYKIDKTGKIVSEAS